jgi:uncharacterized protein with HEPN domain
MNTPDDKNRLEHILEAAGEAVDFLGSKNEQELLKDRMAFQAIVRSIEIVGEAAAQISLKYRNEHPEIPWVQIIGMRNRLVHAYFDVDYRFVYSTVRYDLPILINQVSQLLRNF